jgi:septal ring factor EnvC (AmiA/AmiB activator)
VIGFKVIDVGLEASSNAGARTCLAGNDRTGGIVAVRVKCPRPTRGRLHRRFGFQSLNEVRTHRHNGIGRRAASIIVACRGQRGSLVTLLHGAGRHAIVANLINFS